MASRPRPVGNVDEGSLGDDLDHLTGEDRMQVAIVVDESPHEYVTLVTVIRREGRWYWVSTEPDLLR